MSVLIAARFMREMHTSLLCFQRGKESRALDLREAELWWRLSAMQHRAFARDALAVLGEIRQARR